MPSYAVIKTNKATKESFFLMANAVGTKTFKNDFKVAWVSGDHRESSNMLDRCVTKHNDRDKFDYTIDDLDEVGDW